AIAALLLTAACAPQLTAPSRDVLPVEAARIIDRATATAGAVATQVAVVTAQARADMATSTAGAAATTHSLAVAQTHVALRLAEAQATDAAGVIQAVRTQA